MKRFTYNKKKTNFVITFLFLAFTLAAQSISFSDDAKKRGYYDRPYKRYEAEPGKCVGSGLFLSPTYMQTEIQSEASNQIAVQLIEKNSYVEWKNEEAADGMVIRFSIPDSNDGKGTKGSIALYVDGKFIQNIELDSYWAWQYALKTGQTYPDNLSAENKFARMRFDEVRVRLANKIPQGASFKLVKADDNKVPYTIDFVELEAVPDAVTFESITDENKVKYSVSDGELDKFVANNGGKTIYLPEGKYDVSERIVIDKPNTKLIGAGMWYTEIYFSASSDNIETYMKRGIQSDVDNIVLDGLFITTVNNKRYYNNESKYQVGKGLMGSFGKNSLIQNVWIEHFECGGWIDGATNLTVKHCRFRNHYADGINLSFGSKNSVVEHCSFRNNGDDDMASWSRGKEMCENITYRYCTAENNWRASSVGFFGGKGHKASALVIIDPMEAALRVTTDFPGREFSNEGLIVYDDISIYRAGGKSGALGVYGDIIDGSESGAIHITSYLQYDLRNIKFSNIDIYNSKWDAIFIDCRNSKKIENLYLENIRIDGTGRYGISFHNATGEIFYCNLNFESIGAGLNMGDIPHSLKFIPVNDCH